MSDLDLFHKHLHYLQHAHAMLLERAPTPAKKQFLRGVMEGLKLAGDAIISAKEVNYESLFQEMEKGLATVTEEKAKA